MWLLNTGWQTLWTRLDFSQSARKYSTRKYSAVQQKQWVCVIVKSAAGSQIWGNAASFAVRHNRRIRNKSIRKLTVIVIGAWRADHVTANPGVVTHRAFSRKSRTKPSISRFWTAKVTRRLCHDTHQAIFWQPGQRTHDTNECVPHHGQTQSSFLTTTFNNDVDAIAAKSNTELVNSCIGHRQGSNMGRAEAIRTGVVYFSTSTLLVCVCL